MLKDFDADYAHDLKITPDIYGGYREKHTATKNKRSNTTTKK